VPEEGVEPTWTYNVHWILNPARLPIPPLRQVCFIVSVLLILSEEEGSVSLDAIVSLQQKLSIQLPERACEEIKFCK
jgi:hypothetical protein